MPTTTGISFDGVNDTLQKTWSGKTNSSNKKFTLSAWLEVPSGAAGETAAFASDNHGGGSITLGITGSDGFAGIIPAQRAFIFIQNDNGDFYLYHSNTAITYGAKYFFMVVYDTAQATAGNRVKAWFGPYNGAVALTSSWTDPFGTGNNLGLNTTLEHGTGTGPDDYAGWDTSTTYYKGKLADVYWLDNVALADPSALVNNYSSAAAPGTYAGAYGNTGYHLDFSNSGSLGADSSGNSNNFTPAGGPTQLTGYFASGGATLSAAAGSFVWTGTAAGLRKAKTVIAASGAFSWSGLSAGLRRGAKVPAAAGSYAFSGTAASLRKGKVLGASAGAFTWTGAAAALRRALKISAAAGAYGLAGTAATLTKAGSATKVIAGGAGSFAWSGASASLRRARRSGAGAGSFAWGGVAASLVKSGTAKTIAAGAGAFAWNGASASLRRTGRLGAGAGAYALTGTSAAGRRSKVLGAGLGSYAWNGSSGALRRVLRGSAALGAYTWNGTSAGFVYVPSRVRIAYPSNYPRPRIESFSALVAMGVIRADGATDQAQRRVHNVMPHTYSLTFIMTVAQWGLWYQWAKANGYNWFTMNLPTFYAGLSNSTLSPVLIRFTSGLMANSVSPGAVQVTVMAETAPSMISQYLDAV